MFILSVQESNLFENGSVEREATPAEVWNNGDRWSRRRLFVWRRKWAIAKVRFKRRENLLVTGSIEIRSGIAGSEPSAITRVGDMLYFAANDGGTGKELWKGRLPAGGQATPMTYVWNGKQYVVIAAGGAAIEVPAEVHFFTATAAD